MKELVIYSEEELKKIQQIELDALKIIIDICTKLEIEYFGIGGTALGSIRHNGFIPWDDDIDIGMTRDNYERFANEAPELLPKGYHLQNPYDNTINPYPYMKVRVDGTQFVEYCNRKVKCHHGIYVDIFPFDEVPDDENENMRQFNSVQRLAHLFAVRQNHDVSLEPSTKLEKVKSLVRQGVHYLIKMIPYSLLFHRLEIEMKRYNGTNQAGLACLLFPKRKTEYVLKETLYPLQKHRFEDIEINIPYDYDTYLKSHYGNYLELPPTSQRFGHKPYFVSFGELIDGQNDLNDIQ